MVTGDGRRLATFLVVTIWYIAMWLVVTGDEISSWPAFSVTIPERVTGDRMFANHSRPERLSPFGGEIPTATAF